MEWKLELNLQTKTFLTRGSEFLMDWISWSQTWTKSTTTTSRKPLRWEVRSILRWNRMHLLLQVDQRLKQNQEDRPLLAHLQELYLFCERSMDWYWTRSSIRQSSVPSGKKTEHSSSAWTITSRRRWSDRILEIGRLSSERIWALSTVGLMRCGRAKWQEAEGTRKYFNIVLILVRTRNSSSPSSSRSFRTQSHWSFTTGQCVNSGQFLRVHLSYWMCNQFTLHHKFRIDSGRTKFKQGKTDGHKDWALRNHAAWNPMYWVDIQLAQRRWKFYQTRCTRLSRTLSRPVRPKSFIY